MSYEITVHVNGQLVSSDTYDLDVYDRFTLCQAIKACAGHVNIFMSQGAPDKAKPYTEFKNRIKDHLYG